MGRRTNISDIVVKDKIFQMDELAVDLQRGTSISELHALNPARANRRTGSPLVQTRDCDTGAESRSHQGCHADFRDFVSH